MKRGVPIVAIVGRTNVGKSTLFNALIGRRISIVEDVPGVTRDRHYATVNWGGKSFSLVDTGGLVGAREGDELHESVRAQAEIAIEESDLVLAVFDGLAGPHPGDDEVVDLLRRSGKKVLWTVNKCEKPGTAESASEFYNFGIDEFTTVSAAHRLGIQLLAGKIMETLGLGAPAASREEAEQAEGTGESREDAPPHEEAEGSGEIRVAVIGKPNVGKSSIINRVLGEERLVASAIPGTTTDSIDVHLTRDKKEYIFVDTAGLRKKSRVESGTVERYGNLRTLRALARCDVAVLVLDATEAAPSEQDLKIAALAHERGKGLVVVVNKWDAVEKDHRTVKHYKDVIQHAFNFAKYAPILFVSALSGRRCPSILETAREVYEAARYRMPTSELNRILSSAFNNRPPPVYRGEPIRLFFATQIGVAPPTIVLFLNHPKRLSPSYQRYLRTAIRKQVPFPGIDIKFHPRKRTAKEEREAAERA
jgi:GTP-binding protein